jgi:hypothetical protein
MQQQKKRRGGDVKKLAPAGFYTPKEAMARLGLNRNTFYYYVRSGKISKYIPPLKSEGYYAKKEIDMMATEIALYFHTHVEEQTGTETRIARAEDVAGVCGVLDSFGWKRASVEQRLSWYEVNPFIDYVVLHDGNVQGYITAVPYRREALEDMMAGRKRAWHIKPSDILPYQQGKTYDLYVGIAVRQDSTEHTRYAFRLISGFLSFLEELAAQGIRIRRLYGVSAEAPGQKLSRAIGFVEQTPEPGDLFPRFMLDMETSSSAFAQRYRATVSLQ